MGLKDQTLANIFKDAREKAGLTQAQLAKKAGISANYYARVERNDPEGVTFRFKHTNKSSVVINKDSFEVPDVVSLIYQMNGKAYFASYKSAFNGQKEGYYLIENGKTVKQDNVKIVLIK
jgi:transcriptional regulator with XRE-family HTH domain